MAHSQDINIIAEKRSNRDGINWNCQVLQVYDPPTEFVFTAKDLDGGPPRTKRYQVGHGVSVKQAKARAMREFNNFW